MIDALATKQDIVKLLTDKGYEVLSSGYYYLPGTYVTKHGNYERPDYAPRRYKDGWGVHCTYYYYSGTHYAPLDGRISLDCL